MPSDPVLAAPNACANCATPLTGGWCHCCGQRATAHHRSLRQLAAELLSEFTQADGRLWRTLRLLAINPARLTSDYVTGHRAAEIPPLRLFFITLLIVFATSPLSIHRTELVLPPATQARLTEQMDLLAIPNHPAATAWFRTHVNRAIASPADLALGMSERAERFAFLLLPLSALTLRALFPFRRDVALYDHLIFTMHSLSFAGLFWVAASLIDRVVHHRLAYMLLLGTALSVHLFRHLKGFYRTGTVGTLIRMLILFSATLAIFILLLVALALLSFSLLSTG